MRFEGAWNNSILGMTKDFSPADVCFQFLVLLFKGVLQSSLRGKLP